MRKEFGLYGARTRLAMARQRQAFNDADFDETSDGELKWSVEGFDIVVSCEVDEFDSSRGNFTDGAYDDTIVNPDWFPGADVYKYWSPESGETVESMTKAFSRYHGMSKSVAHAFTLKVLREECRRDVESHWLVKVVASRNGVRLAIVYLGGCDIDSSFDLWEAVRDHDLDKKAVTEARDTLKGLCA